MSQTTPEWKRRAQKKNFPSEFVERLDESTTVTEAEKEKIVDSLADIPELVELPPNAQPVTGIHYVMWGHGSLSMTDRYPVLRSITITESEYVTRMGEEAQTIVDRGLKDPDPGPGLSDVPKSRRLRAEAYARWRYRGYLAREVASL